MNNIRACLQFLCLCLILSAFGNSLLAETLVNQINNPSMTSKSYFTGDNEKELKNLKIKRLDISVTLNNAYAETRVLVDFYNPTEEQLEGDFVLDMPYGSIVTGYGLDIDGRMVAGVIVEKERAKKIFEDRIREGVDPGLAEVTRENAFKTRVFPIDAHQTRRVSLRFVSQVSNTSPYVLPLLVDEPIDEFSLEVISQGLDTSALIKLPSNLKFSEAAENLKNSTRIKRLKENKLFLSGDLVIKAKNTPDISIERHSNGQAFLAANIKNASLITKEKKAVKKVRIYWDSSLSQEDNVQQAIGFIQQVLPKFKKAKFELVQFSNDVDKNVLATKSAEKIISSLNKVRYHSATNIENLFISQAARKRADICLLFTDGRNTLGEFPKKQLPCKLFTISAAQDTNVSSLELLAKYGGGQYIDLNRVSAFDAIELLKNTSPRLVSLQLNGVNKTALAEWKKTLDAFQVIVPIEEHENNITLQFENQNFDFNFSQTAIPEANSQAAFWAKQKIDSSRAQGRSREDLVALSKTYSVAGEETSFLVLETVEDYVQNSVNLPLDGFDTELQEKYQDLLAQKKQNEQDAKDSRLQNMISQWQKQKEWYARDFAAEAKAKKFSMADSPVVPMQEPQRSIANQSASAEFASTSDNVQLEEIVVTARRREESLNDVVNITGAVDKSIAIDIKAWSPDRVYLKAVEGYCGQKFMAVYFAQRDEYGDSPSFYLEMADALARCKDVPGAIKIALSALELPTANKDTISAVAQRLLSFDSYANARDLLEQAIELEPDSPQPYRNLALALQKSADSNLLNKQQKREYYIQALSLLNQVITKPWENDYAGIGLISIMEANLLHQKIKQLGENSKILDKRLTALLDVDVRILISWNVDRTDVDLWVDEPTGERVNYSNKLSALGGRISNDMTNGYGPEEYLLKKTIAGDYQIKVHYYGSDIVNPNGAVIVRAHIFRNWGRENQTVEVADLEFTEQDSDYYSVATLTVR